MLNTTPYTTQSIPALQYSLLNEPVCCVALRCVASASASACLRNCCVPCSLFVTTSTLLLLLLLLLLFVDLSCVASCDVVVATAYVYLR